MNTYHVSFSSPNRVSVYVNARTYQNARRNAARKVRRSVRDIHTISLVSYTPIPIAEPKRSKVLTCDDCGCQGPDVVETTCPYASDVYNDPNCPATLCGNCCTQRANDI